MRSMSKALCLMVVLLLSSAGVSAAEPVLDVSLGHASEALTAPWRFHTGDDARWATPAFDDSTWETFDLTPPPGAHDGDVGLSGYVPGWAAHGHADYLGYAWYRLHLRIAAPADEALALLGPAAADDVYQIYLDGKLLGGEGGFAGKQPAVYGLEPHLFTLPALAAGEHVVAVRVWMGPWEAGDPQAGGMHIAPELGTLSGATARYRAQWSETLAGYVVEAVEALAFVLLAVMALSLLPFAPGNRAYLWSAAGLLLLALFRGNQAFFFWSEHETVGEYEFLIQSLVIPLSLTAWTLAWRAWFELEDSWMPKAVLALSLLYVLAALGGGSWFYGVFPSWLASAVSWLAVLARIGFAVLMGLVVYQGMRRGQRENWQLLPALSFMSIALFAQELSALHVQGIWFPFGVGVSRTQYAYAVFDLVFFILLLRRLWGYARDARPHLTETRP